MICLTQILLLQKSMKFKLKVSSFFGLCPSPFFYLFFIFNFTLFGAFLFPPCLLPHILPAQLLFLPLLLVNFYCAFTVRPIIYLKIIISHYHGCWGGLQTRRGPDMEPTEGRCKSDHPPPIPWGRYFIWPQPTPTWSNFFFFFFLHYGQSLNHW